jgi:hypothetical protein
MRFTVPQFIEREAKIVGPLTFRQFIFVAIAAAICFLFYFSLPFNLFLLSCAVLGGGALAFAFLQIGGRSLPTVLSNFLRFNLTPKMYIWKKTEAKIEIIKKEVKKKEETEEELPLKINEKSQLKKIKTRIETKTK